MRCTAQSQKESRRIQDASWICSLLGAVRKHACPKSLRKSTPLTTHGHAVHHVRKAQLPTPCHAFVTSQHTIERTTKTSLFAAVSRQVIYALVETALLTGQGTGIAIIPWRAGRCFPDRMLWDEWFR